MGRKYLLEWLDILVSVTLNPEKTLVQKITEEQVEFIVRNIRRESASVKSKLKHQVFSLTREKHIRLVVENYHTSLLILLDQVSEQQKNDIFQREDLLQVMDTLQCSLQELISFLETWFTHYLKPDNVIKKRTYFSQIKDQEKILCNLSTDQTALVLRAADELRILKAKSMRHVFRTIVPYLSTPHKKDLSYDSLRVKAYTPEEKDKEATINQLQRMIKKIKEY
ncbi:hypothetical protein [Sinomicrobium weinanense]|uniref:Uncharacterized protein n=1 Tax=Sinomicrobium weinanense TaxID=2842200 RepID=A0A926JUK2_9FLAO|nr:hypothetical protein [Sinomicrobium weinanense]MBC9797594.1 hypothetical protein [Sinomicrobium weinanense]MBU3123661.1 hypothetical protein [Sinomicrobium weinanense]